MGLGHKKMGVNVISITYITYKEEEVLIIGSVRSLSDDPYAEHRIFQHFNPTFILVNFKKDIAIVGRHGDFSLSFHAGSEFRASACGNQIAAFGIISSSLHIWWNAPDFFQLY